MGMKLEHTFIGLVGKPSSDIHDCLREAIVYAKWNNDLVTLVFNGVEISVDQNDKVNDLIIYYHDKLNQRKTPES